MKHFDKYEDEENHLKMSRKEQQYSGEALVVFWR
jgi:hypothetical protein